MVEVIEELGEHFRLKFRGWVFVNSQLWHWYGSLNPNLYVMFVNVCILNFMCNVHGVMGDTE
jgi:hypothetical protein